MVDLNEVQARFILANICEPGDSRINKIAVKHQWPELLLEPKLLPEIYQSALTKVSINKLLEDIAGANFITPQSDYWPLGIDDLGLGSPIGLWWLGDIQKMNPVSIAIVGARGASVYGISVASELAMELAAMNINIISGGAFGIDAAAHQGALQGNGFTVAVMAGGVDCLYPKTNSSLFQRITDSGLIISEVPPTSPPLRHRFLVRNRLIAAMSRSTVVVEARIKSGAMSTANEATNLGRDVMAVPGSIRSANSTGCHKLIRDGAVLVSSAAEICELLVSDYPQYA